MARLRHAPKYPTRRWLKSWACKRDNLRLCTGHGQRGGLRQERGRGERLPRQDMAAMRATVKAGLEAPTATLPDRSSLAQGARRLPEHQAGGRRPERRRPGRRLRPLAGSGGERPGPSAITAPTGGSAGVCYRPGTRLTDGAKPDDDIRKWPAGCRSAIQWAQRALSAAEGGCRLEIGGRVCHGRGHDRPGLSGRAGWPQVAANGAEGALEHHLA